jgi:hypothetical protein
VVVVVDWEGRDEVRKQQRGTHRQTDRQTAKSASAISFEIEYSLQHVLYSILTLDSPIALPAHHPSLAVINVKPWFCKGHYFSPSAANLPLGLLQLVRHLLPGGVSTTASNRLTIN